MNEYSFLYIEDNPMSRDAVQMIMTRVMHLEKVYIFADSKNVLDRIRALPNRPDVILLDIHMMPHDGFTVLKMLRNDPEFADTIVVACTASVMNEEVDQLKSSGFNGAIGKPISVSTFPSLIERIIHGESMWHVTDY